MVVMVGVAVRHGAVSVRHPRALRGGAGRGGLALRDCGQRRNVRQVRRVVIGGIVDVVFHRGFLAANAAHRAPRLPAPAPSPLSPAICDAGLLRSITRDDLSLID